MGKVWKTLCLASLLNTVLSCTPALITPRHSLVISQREDTILILLLRIRPSVVEFHFALSSHSLDSHSGTSLIPAKCSRLALFIRSRQNQAAYGHIFVTSVLRTLDGRVAVGKEVKRNRERHRRCKGLAD